MRDVHTDEGFRQEISAWLRANGIEPARTPMNAFASIADGRITILQKIQRNGRDQVINGEVATETVMVPLLVEPAHDVAEWLRPKCPECGR